MALQFRRGTDSDRLTITPAAGEPIFTSDTKELFIGDGSTTGGVDLITTKLGSISGSIIPDTDSTYDLGSPTKKFKDLHLSGNSIFLGDGLILSNDGGTFAAKDSDNNPVVISLTSNNTGQLSEGTNLYYTTARADSAFDVRLATKTTANITEGSNLYFTNARADARITNALLDEDNMASNSATKIPSQQSVKAYVDAEVAGIVDTAPAALNTLNELAAALGDDANFSTTITNSIGTKLTSAQTTALIDSAYVQARTTAGTDSAATISLIGTTVDSAYVQARQTSGGGGSIDSAATIALVDSAYVQARQTSGGSGSIDSAATIALVDSAYIQSRQTTPIPAFTKVSISGQGDVVADADAALPNWASGTQQQKLTSSDAATGDKLGQQLDISGDGNYALASAPSKNSSQGAVYVFLKSGSTWAQQAKLTASVSNNDQFGIGARISEDGSTAIIGARNGGSGINGTGEAYIFTRSGTTWSQQAKLTASDAADGDLFGAGVDISDDGDTVVIGAYGEDTGGNATGSAYVFTRSGTTWTQQQKIQSSDIEAGDNFGIAVGISGNSENIIVGAQAEDTGGSNAGSAYVFTLSGSTWSQQAKIQASSSASDELFGLSVDISTDGNTVAIGSMDDTGGTDVGAAYVFTRSGTSWTQQDKIQDSNKAASDGFGANYFGRGVSLSGSGNVLVVGASGDDDNGSNSGSTFVFTRSGSTWSLSKKIATSDAAAGDENGWAVAVDKNGDTLLTASYKQSSSTGSLYVWTAPIAVQLEDTLTLEAGTGITLTTAAGTDTVTITGSAAGNDSATTIALIDSAYVQARQIKYTNADFTDSAYVTSQINSVIDAAPGALNTLNELAAALGDDASFSTTITNQIAGKLDSAATTALVDSSYVQARALASSSVTSSATAPSSPSSGDMWFDTTDTSLLVYYVDSDGAQWVDISGATGATGATGPSGSPEIIKIDSDLTTTDSDQVIHSFSKSTYRTIKYTAQLENDDSSGYHAEELLLTHNGTNVAITSYAKLALDSDLGIFDAAINGSDVELRLTPTKVNTHVKLRAITITEGNATPNDINALLIPIDSDLTTTDSDQVIHSFSKSTYRTMKYVAQLKHAGDNAYHSQEILLAHNGTSAAITGYAKLLLDSSLGTFDAAINGNNVELRLTPAKTNTNVKLRAIRTTV
jgi:hypothetical protein